MNTPLTEELHEILKDVELTDINDITFEILMKTAQTLFQHNVYDKQSCEYSFNKGYIKLYHKDRLNHNSLEVFNKFNFNDDISELKSQTSSSSNSVIVFDIEQRFLYLLLYDKVLNALKPVLKIRFKHIASKATENIKLKNVALDNFLNKLFFNSVENTAESNINYIENILINEHLNEKLDNNLHAQYLIKRYLNECKQEFVENITDFIEESYNPDIVDINKFRDLLNDSDIDNLIGDSDYIQEPTEELSQNMNEDLDVIENNTNFTSTVNTESPINAITDSSMGKFFSNTEKNTPITVVQNDTEDIKPLNDNVTELKEVEEEDKDKDSESEYNDDMQYKQNLSFR